MAVTNERAIEMVKAESRYLARVEAKFEAAKGKQFRGSIWRTARFDQSDRLRATMANHRVYDREKLKSLPHNRSIALHGYRRAWWFGKRATGVAIATVLCPLDSLVSPDSAGPEPIGYAELVDHVRRMVSDARVPHVIGVCAPSGFTKEALHAQIDIPNVTIVLAEPRAEGGWSVISPTEGLPESVLSLFDPEDDDDRVDRVKEEIYRRSADLLTGGLSAASIARRLEVPESMVQRAMAKVAREDPELRVSQESEGTILYRGVLSSRPEKTSMSMIDRIRQLFSRDGDEIEKINMLVQRRARLAERKDRLYEDVSKLEEKEAELLEKGRQAQSAVVKQRLASQLYQLRKEIGRQHATTNMLAKQIDIISTDIHNLTLIQQGQSAQLPTTEELTENAVAAEEMLESLNADAELVSGLEAGMAESSMSDGELDILKEFEEEVPEKQRAEERQSAAASRTKVGPEFVKPESSSADPPTPDSRASKRRVDPEAT